MAWATTPLGDVETWSPTLQAATRLVLATEFPAALLWGPRFALIYNAAFVPILAEKHPLALGASAEDVFAEVWETVGPWMQDVRDGRGAKWVQDAYVPLVRDGRLDEAYFTFCYSAVENERGAVEGVIDIVTETTTQIVGPRRLGLLTELRRALAAAETEQRVQAQADAIFERSRADLAAIDLRLVADGGAGALTTSTPPPASFAASDLAIVRDHGQPVAWLALGLAARIIGDLLHRRPDRAPQTVAAERVGLARRLGDRPTEPRRRDAVRPPARRDRRRPRRRCRAAGDAHAQPRRATARAGRAEAGAGELAAPR